MMRCEGGVEFVTFPHSWKHFHLTAVSTAAPTVKSVKMRFSLFVCDLSVCLSCSTSVEPSGPYTYYTQLESARAELEVVHPDLINYANDTCPVPDRFKK